MSADTLKPGLAGAVPVYGPDEEQMRSARVEGGDIDAVIARLARLLGRQLARDIHAAAHDKKVGG